MGNGYNSQVNKWGGANWTEGGPIPAISQAGVVRATESTLLSDLAKTGLDAAIGGGLFSPSATGKIVGGDAMLGVDKAIQDVKSAASVEGITPEKLSSFKTQFDTLNKLKSDITGSRGYGDEIYSKGTFQFGDAPKGGVLADNIDNRFMGSGSSWHKAREASRDRADADMNNSKYAQSIYDKINNPSGLYTEEAVSEVFDKIEVEDTKTNSKSWLDSFGFDFWRK